MSVKENYLLWKNMKTGDGYFLHGDIRIGF